MSAVALTRQPPMRRPVGRVRNRHKRIRGSRCTSRVDDIVKRGRTKRRSLEKSRDEKEGRKAILVCTEHPALVRASCFFSVDETYFPLRPDDQRRLLSDGTLGSEGETASSEYLLQKFDYPKVRLSEGLHARGRGNCD